MLEVLTSDDPDMLFVGGSVAYQNQIFKLYILIKNNKNTCSSAGRCENN